MITGKLNTAIRIVLLLALAAIPESSVRDEAKPSALNKIVIQNKKASLMGLLKNSTKNANPAKERIPQSKKL